MNPLLFSVLLEFLPSLHRWSKEHHGSNVVKHAEMLVKNITGVEDPRTVANMLKTQPKVLIQLQKAWFDYEQSLINSDIEDRNNARQREIALFHYQGKRWRGDIMALGAVLGLSACLGMLIYGPPLTGEVIGIISTIAGIFGSCLKDVYAFEFGSSRSSQEKTNLLTRFRQ